jgi:hypothetical protein
MSKIHVLAGGINNVYTVAVHAPTPAGNNGAGVPWTTAVQNSGRNTSVLSVGNAAGQIAQNEMNQITSGTVIEGVMQWGDDPTWTNQQRLDDLDLRATQLTTELLARYQAELRYFGFTRA